MSAWAVPSYQEITYPLTPAAMRILSVAFFPFMHWDLTIVFISLCVCVCVCDNFVWNFASVIIVSSFVQKCRIDLCNFRSLSTCISNLFLLLFVDINSAYERMASNT